MATPAPAPTPAPTRTYPGTDPFGITGVGPSTLTTAGGRVRITGRDLEPGVRVRIGDTTPASVVGYASGATADAVTIMVPPLVAGTYDLLVSTVDGRAAVLDDALTITGTTASPSPGAPGTAPTTAPTPAPSGSTGPGGTAPSSPAPPAPSPTPAPTGPAAAPGGPVVKAGPGGLRLVAASARWSAVPSPAWTASGCDSGCTGTVV